MQAAADVQGALAASQKLVRQQLPSGGQHMCADRPVRQDAMQQFTYTLCGQHLYAHCPVGQHAVQRLQTLELGSICMLSVL